MSFKEEDKAKLKRQSGRQSIALAVEGKWQEAIDANKAIIENFPDDVNAYNRLGRAYTELGDYARARAAYEKAIEIDTYNSIAKKNLSRLSLLGEAGAGHEGHKIEPHQFIEEVGKAGVVNLTHVASPEVLAKMVAGEAVVLKVDGTNLTVENDSGEYLGHVGNKTGQRLVKLMEGGNKYTAAIVSASESSVTVIIREVFQDPSQAGKFSFSPRESEGLRPYVAGWLGERIVRRELEEEKGPDSRGFIIVGGEEAETDQEVLVDESGEDTEEVDEE
ncbi:MAG: tetratricopeptide repeat protein [Dehalococcoidales bacterium]|nr:tetratricopeptide repeat protein [Dehalococcoidales bacterium]